MKESGESSNEMSEQEHHTRTNVKRLKTLENRSIHWEPYIRVEVEEGVPPVKVVKAQCKQCSQLIAVDDDLVENDTIALKYHTAMCSESASSFQASGTGPSTRWSFDQDEARKALCEMVVLDGLPFKFVEGEGFKKFIACICPEFLLPSRKELREDCIRLFLERKEVFKSFFRNYGTGRVSITTECWTSIKGARYVSVAAHFIGKDWDLHRKIISFRKIVDHKGDAIADSIIQSLKEWGLKTVVCCTVVNAPENERAVHCVGAFLDAQKTSFLGGKHIQMGCATHIINQIVSDCLDEIGTSVRRVREAVKWIKASPMRNAQFRNCAKALRLDCTDSFSSDVPTRWNSTYFMLKAAEPYEAAWNLFGSTNADFVADLKQNKHNNLSIGPPEAEDWNNVRKMLEYLTKFYELTRLFSGTAYVKSHLFFMEICDLFDLISEFEKNTDVEISLMARKMKIKVGKYWLETDTLNPKINKHMYIAAILDPRQKMRHVERCLEIVYGGVLADDLVREVRNSMVEMFDVYKNMLTTTPSQSHNVDQGLYSFMLDSSDDETEDSDSSELTLYLAEKYKKNKTTTTMSTNQKIGVDNFDILNWWSQHGRRFPILSEMARDILAVPVSIVTSESTFKTGGRVLDAFRSSLDPSTLEALICAGNWLRSSSTDNEDEEDQPEEEEEEEFINALSSLRAGESLMSEPDESGSSGTMSSIDSETMGPMRAGESRMTETDDSGSSGTMSSIDSEGC